MMAAADLTATAHESVLLAQAVDLLVTRPEGRYVDGTFGRGGHSLEVLTRLNEQGRLLGIDKDPQAIEVGDELARSDSRFAIAHGSFAELNRFVDDAGWADIDGLLLDLGVSSPQLDDAARGFSFMRDGPLDMRMNTREPPSAAQWLNQAGQEEIANVIYRYGEEKFSRRIARLVVEARQEAAIETTWQLADLVSRAIPRKEKHKHPATRTFQAIRIFINRELEDLEQVLTLASERLAPGGRLVVISFHSLEDRIVKRFMRDTARGPQLPKGLPVTAAYEDTGFRLIGKAVKADDREIHGNIRARSAVLRVLERKSGPESGQGESS